jgi:hypothetical protein
MSDVVGDASVARASTPPAGPVRASTWLVWILANLVGGVLLALADTGPRLLSLSRLHGPSLPDAGGAVILTAGWVALDAAVWARRRTRRRVAGGWLTLGIAVAVVGVAILVPSILLDLGPWWILGVALLAGVQIAVALALTRGAGAQRSSGPAPSGSTR